MGSRLPLTRCEIKTAWADPAGSRGGRREEGKEKKSTRWTLSKQILHTGFFLLGKWWKERRLYKNGCCLSSCSKWLTHSTYQYPVSLIVMFKLKVSEEHFSQTLGDYLTKMHKWFKSVQLFQKAQSDTVRISLRDTVKFKYYTSLPSPESLSQQDVSLLWWQILSAIVALSGTLWPDTHEITRNRPQVLFRKGLYRSKSEQAPKMPLQPPGFQPGCYAAPTTRHFAAHFLVLKF